MKRIKYLAAFLYIVLLLFAMANLFPREDVKVMSFLRVENWTAKTVSDPAPVETSSSESGNPISLNGFWKQMQAQFWGE